MSASGMRFQVFDPYPTPVTLVEFNHFFIFNFLDKKHSDKYILESKTEINYKENGESEHASHAFIQAAVDAAGPASAPG